MVAQKEPATPERLSEAALMAAAGISRRYLIRLRQSGFVHPLAPRHGLGRGRGTTPLEYLSIAVATINRLKELQREFKEVDERRWHLWREGYPVRIAPDLADTLGRLTARMSEIKSLEDIETKFISLAKPAYMPRGHPLRVIFRDLSEEDLRSVTTMLMSVILGIRLPLFDERNPYPFQVFKRALGLPKEWQLPPGLFDVFPYLHEQVRNALLTASADELEGARAACRLLSRIFDNPENWRRGAIAVAGAPLPWRTIKLVGLIWPSPVMRAVTVGFAIFGMRAFKSAFGEDVAAAFAALTAGTSILFPGASLIDTDANRIKNLAGPAPTAS
jgi:hypothetical protein